MYKISKQFELCYAHRVWTQDLCAELSDNSVCKCKQNHGHNSIITVELQREYLNNQGMLLDYVNLNWFKKFVDGHLDHKTILDVQDPWTLDFVNATRPVSKQFKTPKDLNKSLKPKLINGQQEYFIIDTPSDKPHHQELINGLVLVPFVPTSENLCKWLFNMVSWKLRGNIVQAVSFSETPKTLAVYSK
tara:strand:+ start:3299 stop:3865 length:567 start_codon:yes stop_codon:yes gene_type:complete